jgi:rhamnulokinase
MSDDARPEIRADAPYVTVVAVDLGAGSGRVVLARIGRAGIRLHEVHRFRNEPVQLTESAPRGGLRAALHWDAVRLFDEVVTGLRSAVRGLAAGERIDSIGIDSWAVDYGLLDRYGALVGTPYCYRDDRTLIDPGTGRGMGGADAVHASVAHADLYARNGLQYLPFNTVYQLAAEPAERLAAASSMLLLPDLLGYWLTGAVSAEVTNASTTGLLDLRTRGWDVDLAATLGLPRHLFPPIVEPGQRIGGLLPHVATATGLPTATPVIAVGSHDTASAVVALPVEGDRYAYISSGTWSLVGLELPEPILTDAARAANFTNEGGVDGRIRFLRNVMGLWLLSETLRSWEVAGSPHSLDPLLQAAAALPGGGPLIDPDDPVFLPPGDMPARIAAALGAAGLPAPQDAPAVVRCILDSLAAAYARTIDDAVTLSGRSVDLIHVVGGGSRNALLCALTARATGRPVLAGPVEATAIGNALIQARALGAVGGDLADLRALVRTGPLTRYEPDGRGRTT